MSLSGLSGVSTAVRIGLRIQGYGSDQLGSLAPAFSKDVEDLVQGGCGHKPLTILDRDADPSSSAALVPGGTRNCMEAK